MSKMLKFIMQSKKSTLQSYLEVPKIQIKDVNVAIVHKNEIKHVKSYLAVPKSINQ
jgi:hypothetical protein